MIEMIVVLIIMAVMASYVMSRTATSSTDMIAQAEILKSHLRYAQIKAMNDTVSWGIYIPNANSYILYRNNTQATALLPGENAQTHTLPSNVTITSGASATYNFNEWGTPVNGAGVSLTTNQTITLSQGTNTDVITITKNTGYIP